MKHNYMQNKCRYKSLKIAKTYWLDIVDEEELHYTMLILRWDWLEAMGYVTDLVGDRAVATSAV